MPPGLHQSTDNVPLGGRPGRAWPDIAVGGAVVRALLGARRLVVSELLVCAGLLAALGIAVFGTHVANGGFYNDDWAFSAIHRFREEAGIVGAVEAFGYMSFRPLATVYWPATHEVFGLDPSLHLAWVLAMAVTMSLALYALLRTLGLERLHAGVIAALVLIFPASDAPRLWAAASIALPAIALYLLGTTLALRGLGAAGRRSLLMHGGAVALYVLSVMTYEVASGAILISVLVYRLGSTWRRAASRWIADLAALVPVLYFVTSNTWNEPQPVSVQIEHAWTIVKQAASVLAFSAVPYGQPRAATVGALLLAVVAAGALVWRLMPATDPARALLRRWLLMSGASVVAIAAGYLTYIPADPIVYSPLRVGQFNRVNVLATIGYVLLIYSVTMVASLIVFRGLPRWRIGSAALALGASAMIALGYTGQVRADIAAWDRSAAIQDDVIAAVASALPDPPPGSVIYTFGHPSHVDPVVPVFAASWDLDGAVKNRWNDPSLNAYPVVPETTFDCGRHGWMAAHNYNNQYGSDQSSPYGKAYLVDVVSGSVARVDSRASCRRLTDRFLAGSA